jgi:hypothetical protein
MDRLNAGWHKYYSDTYRGNSGVVCRSRAVHRGTLYPTAVKLFEDELIEGLHGYGYYTLGYVLSSSAENFQILSHSFFRRL